MDQTNVIVGATIVAFIIFVTVKGELPAYMGFLLGATTGASPSGGITITPGQGNVFQNAPVIR